MTCLKAPPHGLTNPIGHTSTVLIPSGLFSLFYIILHTIRPLNLLPHRPPFPVSAGPEDSSFPGDLYLDFSKLVFFLRSNSTQVPLSLLWYLL